MEAIRLHKVVEKDGEISATGLPCKKGQRIEMILLIEPSEVPEAPYPTARQLLDSGLIGLWEDRKDIDDTAGYARRLREQVQKRQSE
jgi:hypothetical protein